MRKTSCALVILLSVIATATAAQGEQRGCFRAADIPYLENPSCVDASVFWHSTINIHAERDLPLGVMELTIDREWPGNHAEMNVPEIVVLFGVGALDEVPMALAIPKGSILWDTVKAVDVKGTIGMSLDVELQSVAGMRRTSQVTILESHKAFLDGELLAAPEPLGTAAPR